MSACNAEVLLMMIPPDAGVQQLVNAAEVHLILCPVHGTERVAS